MVAARSTAHATAAAEPKSPPWDFVILDSVAKRGSGHTPDRKRPEYWNGSIKWLSLKDSDRLDHLYVSDTTDRITPAGIANSSAVEYPADTVVLSRDAGVGKSAITADRMAVSQHFIAWRCGPRLEPQFLYWWLQSKKPEFERIAIGNTIKTIGLPYFRRLEVPLPSVEEQRAIAAALEGADSLIRSLDRVASKLRDTKRAVMHHLLTGATRLPGCTDEWATTNVGRLGLLSKGRGIRKGDVSLDDAGVPCIRYGEIYTHHNDVIRQFRSFISPEVAYETRRLEKGDIVFASSGETAEEIGKCVAFVGDDEAYVGSDTVVLSPEGHDPRFLGYLLNHSFIVKQKARLAQGDAVVHISARNLASIAVSVPNRREQEAIATVLSDMDAELVALEQRRDKAKLLQQAMMQELLTGRTRLG